MRHPQISFDQLFLDPTESEPRGRYLVAGVDEAGRGPLAGSVVAAAVILDPDLRIDGLNDSKALTALQREDLADEIRAKALAWQVAEASVEEIDRLNILHASMLAMSRAIEGLGTPPHHCLIDGNRCPVTRFNCQAVVKGDALVKEISAASILAKVTRDHAMIKMHEQHPEYGFDSHKGYPTKRHLQALQEHGLLDIHRRSFGPVRDIENAMAGAAG
ncbi:MAG: ribonuclease HII [Pseudomonadota bacterium]